MAVHVCAIECLPATHGSKENRVCFHPLLVFVCTAWGEQTSLVHGSHTNQVIQKQHKPVLNMLEKLQIWGESKRQYMSMSTFLNALMQ